MPPEVVQQYQDIMHRSQWQRAQLEQGGPGIQRGMGSGTGTRARGMGTGTQGTGSGSGPILTLSHSEYMAQLERQLQFYTEAARRLGSEGSRVSWMGFGWALEDWGCQGLPTDLPLDPQEPAKEALYRRNLVENEVSGSDVAVGGEQL